MQGYTALFAAHYTPTFRPYRASSEACGTELQASNASFWSFIFVGTEALMESGDTTN